MSSNSINRGVGAYQIILSVDPLIASNLADKIHTSQDLETAYKGDSETTLFSSEVDGFIELNHDFRFKSKGDSLGPTISIKTFDPGLSFLNSLYFDFIQNSLNFLSDKNSEDVLAMQRYYAELEEVNKRIDQNSLQADHAEASLKAYSGEYAEGKAAATAAMVHDLYDTTADSDKADVDAKIAKLQSQNVQPKVYIMYGIGLDLAHWAGPVECYLGDIKYTNDGKSETVEYIFATDLLTMQFSDSTVGMPEEDSTLFSKTGIPIQAYKTVKNPYTPSPFGIVTRLFEPNWVDNPINFKGKSFSFHDCIVKLISNYLMNLGILNHLVVLPNLDSILSSAINNAIIREFQKPEIFEASLADAYPGIRFDEYTGTEREVQIAKFARNLFLGDGAYTELGFDDTLYRGDPNSRHHPLLTQANENILIDVFNQLGLKVTKISKESSLDIDPAFVVFDEEADTAFHDDDVLTCDNPFDIIGTDYGHPSKVRGDAILRLDWDHESVWGEGEKKDWMKPLDMLMEAINSSSRAVPIQSHAGFVSEVKLSTPILSKFGAGTFMGYVLEGSRAPAFPNKQMFLFGDTFLIKSLIYGHYNVEARKDLPPGAPPDTYGSTWREKGWLSENQDWPLAQVTNRGSHAVQWSWQEFFDPFWNIIYEDIAWQIRTATGKNFFANMWEIANPSELGFHSGAANNMGYFLGSARTPGELVDALPDEFGFESLSEDTLADIFRLNLPIFLANTHNANVLSYSFDANKFLLANLFRSIQEIYANVTKRYGAITEIVDGTRSRDEVYAEVMSVFDGLRSKSGFAGKGLTITTGIGEPVDAEEIYDSLATLLYLDNVGGIKTRVRKRRSNSVLGFVVLFLELFNSQYIGVIKTLPMFHLCNHSDITRDALALIKSTRKINPNASTFHTAEVADFFSGPQTILGFSHTIARDRAGSEFTVQKNVLMEINNE